MNNGGFEKDWFYKTSERMKNNLDTNSGKWVTINNNHVFIKKDGTIGAGLGNKFNGKRPDEIGTQVATNDTYKPFDMMNTQLSDANTPTVQQMQKDFDGLINDYNIDAGAEKGFLNFLDKASLANPLGIGHEGAVGGAAADKAMSLYPQAFKNALSNMIASYELECQNAPDRKECLQALGQMKRFRQALD